MNLEGLGGRTILPTTDEQRAWPETYAAKDWPERWRIRKSCKHLVTVRGWMRRQNGSVLVSSRCWTCLGQFKAIPKSDWEPISDICWSDRQSEEPCARCQSTIGVELHHWAPREFFGYAESDRWPQSWLCSTCHRLWHATIREAQKNTAPNIWSSYSERGDIAE